MLNQIKKSLTDIKNNKSIVLNYTNYVTMDFMANALSAINASPIMSCSPEESEELVKIAHGINVNLGTVTGCYKKAIVAALKANKNYNKVCTLDPVGATASALRKNLSLEYLPNSHIIKGNTSEILALTEALTVSHGIDANNKLEEVEAKAQNLALTNNKIVITTGKTDLITNGKQSLKLNFGSNIMPKLVGTGCVLGAIICAFATVEKNYYKASVLATAFYTLIGEYTANEAKFIGSFKTHFLDNLNNPNWDFIANKLEKHSLQAI